MFKLVIVLVVLSTACGSGGGRVRYYGVSSVASQTIPELKDTEPLTEQAKSALGKGATVAFFPPDACLDRGAVPSGTQQDQQVLRLQCGVVMTELETAAIAAGFQVVSWQSLRGNERPMKYAKDQKVDLLFEVNELGTVDVTDRDSSHQLEFFQETGPGQHTPIAVDRTIADRCRAATAGSRALVGLAATLDVKMVSVATERVLWNYRNTRALDLSRTQGALHYAAHESRYENRRWPWVLIAVGGVVLLAGVESNGNSVLVGSGLLVAGIGVVGLITDDHSTTWEAPAEILCAKPAIPDPFAPPAQVTAATPPDPGASHFEFNDSQRDRDPVVEYRLKLTHDIVADFTVQLRVGKNGNN